MADVDRNVVNFDAWLNEITASIADNTPMDVPCSDCNACCKAAYFIHVEPQDAGARRAIPAELLFPAPGRPNHEVMGFNDKGHCPMLHNDRCSIYADRPNTCRVYDCRIFAVSGIYPNESSKQAVSARAARWRFETTDKASSIVLTAVQKAGDYVRAHSEQLSDLVPVNATQQAIAAIQIHHLFTYRNDQSNALSNDRSDNPPDLKSVRTALITLTNG